MYNNIVKFKKLVIKILRFNNKKTIHIFNGKK